MEKRLNFVALLLVMCLMITGFAGCSAEKPVGNGNGNGTGETDTGNVTPGSVALGSSAQTMDGEYAFLSDLRELKTFYVKVSGENQGEIKGTCQRSGEVQDSIIAYCFSTGSSGFWTCCTGKTGSGLFFSSQEIKLNDAKMSIKENIPL